MHVLQTGTVAVKRRQRDGMGANSLRLLRLLRDREWTEPLPIHAWVIEHEEGIILVDTGETARSTEPGYFPRWHPYFRSAMRAAVEPADEIGPQLEALGISPDDVRWVVLTHLHTDHAGGLSYFPRSEILVSRRELEVAPGLPGRMRGYVNSRWPEWFDPLPVDFLPEPIGPFRESLSLTKAGDVRLVPTYGHTHGHLSVIVEDGEVSVFIAGDASYTQERMLERAVDGVAHDQAEARRTLGRIALYAQERVVIYLPSHDPESTWRLESREPVFSSFSLIVPRTG